jgi:hypothetical protein
VYANAGGAIVATTLLSPKARQAIEATLVEAIYDATRRARQQLLGQAPTPLPSRRALELLCRVAGKRPVITGR